MLKNVSLFEGLSQSQLDRLTERAVTRSYPKGAIVISEGDEAGTLFILSQGSVKVYLSDEAGREVILSTLGPGEYFGELALLDDTPRSASVATCEPCKLMLVQKSALRELIVSEPETSLQMLRGLATRIRRLTDNVRTLALLDVFGRLVHTLEELSVEKDGIRVIEQRLTQQDLASRIGASREMVSRILTDLTRGGYISLEDKRMVIRKKIPRNW
jgi:CRP/FNR family transcriptional regulator, cyclic AMP receptor protein